MGMQIPLPPLPEQRRADPNGLDRNFHVAEKVRSGSKQQGRGTPHIHSLCKNSRLRSIG